MIETLNAFADYMTEHENLALAVMQANSNGQLIIPSLVYQIVRVRPYRSCDSHWAALVLWQVDIYCDPMQGDMIRAYDNLLFISRALQTWLQTYPPEGLINPSAQDITMIPHTPGDKITYIRCAHRYELMTNRQYELKVPNVDDFVVEAKEIGN